MPSLRRLLYPRSLPSRSLPLAGLFPVGKTNPARQIRTSHGVNDMQVTPKGTQCQDSASGARPCMEMLA